MSVSRVDFGSVALTAAARDLTAPLVALRQLSFQLENQVRNDNNQSILDVLDQMRLTIERTFDISDQLDMAVRNDTQLSLAPVHLSRLCKELQSDFEPLLQQIDCRLNFEIPTNKQVVAVANYRALKSIVAGFLTDAIKATSVNSTSKQKFVRLRVQSHKGSVASLEVIDSGYHIDLKKSLQSIGTGLPNPTVSRPEMSSLNILMADRLLKYMSGSLDIQNHRRGGLTVKMKLPVSCQMSLIEGI